MEPKVCLALGGGAARGLAHLGVLKVFENAKLPVDMIAGTSLGALMGGAVCFPARCRVLDRQGGPVSSQFPLPQDPP